MSYDLLIKNGTVVDGTGAPGRRADVGIANGKIEEIGKITEGAKKTIDASNTRSSGSPRSRRTISASRDAAGSRRDSPRTLRFLTTTRSGHRSAARCATICRAADGVW